MVLFSVQSDLLRCALPLFLRGSFTEFKQHRMRNHAPCVRMTRTLTWVTPVHPLPSPQCLKPPVSVAPWHCERENGAKRGKDRHLCMLGKTLLTKDFPNLMTGKCKCPRNYDVVLKTRYYIKLYHWQNIQFVQLRCCNFSRFLHSNENGNGLEQFFRRCCT